MDHVALPSHCQSVAVLRIRRLNGVWSKRRQTKTATVKTATNQNGDKLYGQNGDTVSAKTATNYIVKMATTIGLFVMFLLCLTVHLR